MRSDFLSVGSLWLWRILNLTIGVLVPALLKPAGRDLAGILTLTTIDFVQIAGLMTVLENPARSA